MVQRPMQDWLSMQPAASGSGEVLLLDPLRLIQPRHAKVLLQALLCLVWPLQAQVT